MRPEQTVLIVCSGFLGGTINAIAGGASFMTLPVLVFCGLPSTVANQTSTVALWPGTLASFAVYRRDIEAQPRFALMMALVSIFGGGLGAWILLHTTPRTFDQLLPWLALVATLLFVYGKSLAERFRFSLGEGQGHRSFFQVGALLFVVGIYYGYYGAGAGIVVLAMMAVLGMKNINGMNGLKTLTNVAANASAVAIFVAGGAVAWPVALWMMAGGLAGGYGGAWLARRLPQRYIRGFIIVSGFLTTLYFFYRAYAPGR